VLRGQTPSCPVATRMFRSPRSLTPLLPRRRSVDVVGRVPVRPGRRPLTKPLQRRTSALLPGWPATRRSLRGFRLLANVCEIDADGPGFSTTSRPSDHDGVNGLPSSVWPAGWWVVCRGSQFMCVKVEDEVALCPWPIFPDRSRTQRAGHCRRGGLEAPSSLCQPSGRVRPFPIRTYAAGAQSIRTCSGCRTGGPVRCRCRR